MSDKDIFKSEDEVKKQIERQKLTEYLIRKMRQQKKLRRYYEIFIELTFFASIIFNLFSLMASFWTNFYLFCFFLSNLYFLLGFWKYRRKLDEKELKDNV